MSYLFVAIIAYLIAGFHGIGLAIIVFLAVCLAKEF